MRERFFEQGERVNKKVDAIKRELSGSGISDPSEWHKAIDLETPLNEAEEKSWDESPERQSFTKLLTYIEGEKISVDKEKIENFKNTEDDIERLELLRQMNTAETIQALNEAAHTEGAKEYLFDRLDFYQNLIQGKATRRYTREEWSQKKGKYVVVTREKPIDSSYVTPKTVRGGLFRDTLFASMIGTPEMGVYKIANKKCKDRDLSTKHMVLLKGYHSGIEAGESGSIGYGYPFLQKLYGEARKFIEQRAIGEEKQNDENHLEHRAVLLASE